MSQPAAKPFPPRPSIAAWAALTASLIVGFYVLTLGLAVLMVYLPYLLLESPNSFGLQTIALLLGGLVIAGTLLWSLVPRREKFVPPGPLLEPARHPRLFAEISRLATSLNEQPPKEVYLIADVNAWVAEPYGNGVRVMGLGLPLLQVLTVSRFRAVLAHEFAHYYTGDTRLGPWVYKARTTMVRTLHNVGRPSAALHAITRIGAARLMHHLVTQVLDGYWNVFLKVTQRVSRRQEYRADELACSVAGSRALMEGLQDIQRAEAAASGYWTEVKQVVDAGFLPPIADGFARFMAAESVRQDLETYLAKEIAHPNPNPFDSHPPLHDRLIAMGRLPAGEAPEDNAPSISLIDDVPAMEAQLVRTLDAKRDVQKLRMTTWQDAGKDVFLPIWKKHVEEYAALLTGITAASLPEVTKRFPEIGSRIRDPKGRLLTPQQRTQRGSDLVSLSFALGLLDRGWELNSQPGALYLKRGDEKLRPRQLIQELTGGKITSQAWGERLEALGIPDISLEPAKPLEAAKDISSQA